MVSGVEPLLRERYIVESSTSVYYSPSLPTNELQSHHIVIASRLPDIVDHSDTVRKGGEATSPLVLAINKVAIWRGS
jgi:hypothetical protein